MSEQQRSPEHGIWLVGEYLGVEHARTYTDRQTQEVRNVRPRLGLSVGGEEVAVVCADESQLTNLARGLVKGQPARVRVEVRPPFGARGAVQFLAPGAIESRSFGPRWE